MLGHIWQKDSAPSSSRRAALKLEQLDTRVVPAVVAVNDTFSVVAGRVITTLPEEGVLANDFDNRNFGDVLSAVQVGPPRYVGSNRPLPANAKDQTIQATRIAQLLQITPFQIILAIRARHPAFACVSITSVKGPCSLQPGGNRFATQDVVTGMITP